MSSKVPLKFLFDNILKFAYLSFTAVILNLNCGYFTPIAGYISLLQYENEI